MNIFPYESLVNMNCRDQDSNLGYYGIIVFPQRRVLTTRRSQHIYTNVFLNETMTIFASKLIIGTLYRDTFYIFHSLLSSVAEH
jgi:hypothetical protein